jgi:hypothetical protein
VGALPDRQRHGPRTLRHGAGQGEGGRRLHPSPGEAHQLINAGKKPLLFYIIADNPPMDGCHYPDSNKWLIRQPRKIFRMAGVDYWDGEE